MDELKKIYIYMKKIIKKIIPLSVLKIVKSLISRIQIHLHQGHIYQCPICGYECNDWYVIGNVSSINHQLRLIGAGQRKAGCYKCHSTDKERLLYLYLQDFVKNIKEKKSYTVLHFAPEKDIYKFLSNVPDIKYITADLFPELYIGFAKNIIRMDVTNISLEANTVDLIICNHVLEHVSDDITAMKELYKVLKPNGSAILQVPISEILDVTKEDSSIIGEREREFVFGQSDHVRIYGQDYFQRLSSVGFNVLKINACKEEEKIYFGLNPKEYIFLAKKCIPENR
jgi:SAM-dependent methyltransferase